MAFTPPAHFSVLNRHSPVSAPILSDARCEEGDIECKGRLHVTIDLRSYNAIMDFKNNKGNAKENTVRL